MQVLYFPPNTSCRCSPHTGSDSSPWSSHILAYVPSLLPATITATFKSNYKKRLTLYAFSKENPSWVTPNKNIPLHYTSKPTQMILSPPLRVYFPSKKNKSHSTFFLLNCMTSSIQVTKRGKKTCILKRRIAQSSFIMYIYANSTLVYSRKSLSLLLSLPPGQCVSIRQYVWKAVADRVGESWMV